MAGDSDAAHGRARLERAFSLVMTLICLATVVAGFGRSFFFLPLHDGPPAYAAPERVFLLHGAVFALWPLLLVAQAGFVSAGAFPVHRVMGKAGAALALVVVVVGVLASLYAANRPTGFVDVPMPPEQFLIIPITDILLFGGFAFAGIGFRGAPQTHKRLMLFASWALLPAALARVVAQSDGALPFFLFDAGGVFLVAALVLFDLARGRAPHPATLAGGVVFLGVTFLRMGFADHPAWLAFARFLMSVGPAPAA